MNICIWADGFWCKKQNIEEYYQFMSDDYFEKDVDPSLEYEDIDDIAMKFVQSKRMQSLFFKR